MSKIKKKTKTMFILLYHYTKGKSYHQRLILDNIEI